MMANLTRKHLCVTLAFNVNTSRNLLPRVINNDGYHLRFSRACSSQASTEDEGEGNKFVSAAMRAYMERAREHEAFMKQQIEEFNKGKQFLAKIMGYKSKSIPQNKINEAIKYLFPSGLYHRAARPMMVNPLEFYEAQKKAHIDKTGRPLHYLFYTSKPNYSQLMHECGETLENLNAKLESVELPRSGDPQKPEKPEWISKEELERMLSERLLDIEYEKFVESLNCILEYPPSVESSEFIKKYATIPIEKKFSFNLPTLVKEEGGVTTVTVERCKKKKCYGTVSVSHPGEGKITINGKDFINFFAHYRSRMQVLSPMVLTEMLGKVDVVATVDESGYTNQAMVLRTGISFGLAKLVPPEIKKKLKLAGFLERDPRVKERKKTGQRGARAKYTWLKR